jgi:uncharacterized membrane protein required for colicin V production
MNGLLVVVLAILIFFMFYGYYQGLVKIVFSLCSLVLSMLLVTWMVPYITVFLQENTGVYDALEKVCAEKLEQNLEQEETTPEEVKTQKPDALNIIGVELPAVMQKQITENVTDFSLEKSGGFKFVSGYLAGWMLKGIAFVVAMVLVSILLRVILGVLNVVTRLPVLNGANRILGIGVGFIEGLLVIWLLLFIVTISSTSDFGRQLIGYIEESEILRYLYNNNGIILLFNYILG